MTLRTLLHKRTLSIVAALLFVAGGCQKQSASDPSSSSQTSRAQIESEGELGPLRRLALLPVTDGRPVDALITRLQEQIRRIPDKTDPWIELGRAWIRKARENSEPGYYLQADACASVVLAHETENAAALNLRGLVLLNSHRFAEAEALARRIVVKRDFDPMGWGTLSDALLEQGRIEEAEAAVKKMIEQKPSLPSYSRASYLAFLRGSSAAAKELIRLAIDAAPNSRGNAEPRAFALVQAAQMFFLEGDYSGADAGFVLALQAMPDYPPALVGRGQVALSEGRYAEAEQLLLRAYQLSPLAETAWHLGDARTMQRKDQDAASAYADLLRIGRRTDPRTVALFLAIENRDLQQAQELIDRERSGRNDLYTQDVYAVVLSRRGHHTEAQRSIDGILAVGVRDPRFLYHGAIIHHAAGNKARAHALLQQLLKQSPHFDVIAEPIAQRLALELAS